MSDAVHKICNVLVENVHVALSVLLHALISVVLVAQPHPVGHAQLQYKRVNLSPTHGEQYASMTEQEATDNQRMPQKVVQHRRHLRPPHSIRRTVDRLNHSPITKSSITRGSLGAISPTPSLQSARHEKQVENSKSLPTRHERSSLTKKEVHLLSSRLSNCWSVLSDAAYVSKAVKVSLVLDIHGRVSALTIHDMHIYNSDPIFRAVADSALRAVRKCSPFRELQDVDYEAWKEIELTFDPTPS